MKYLILLLLITCLLILGCPTKTIIIEPNEPPEPNEITEPNEPTEHIAKVPTWRQVMQVHENTKYRMQHNIKD